MRKSDLTRRTLSAIPNKSCNRFSDIRLRGGEKAVSPLSGRIFKIERYQVYNRIKDQDEIRFKISKVQKTGDKVFILTQVSQVN